MHQVFFSQQESHIWKGKISLVLVNRSSTYLQNQKGIHIGIIVSIPFAHMSKLENCICNMNNLHVVLIYMRLWIPLMAMFKSLKLHAKMESSIYNGVPWPRMSSAQHCKTWRIIFALQRLLWNWLLLFYCPYLFWFVLLVLKCIIQSSKVLVLCKWH
jgi:hypothetical protein